MFGTLFGWRKASKCKKLVRRVQCRLKLLKNKRCAITRQLREDVAQLLRHGHEQAAFDRVEQIFLDESMVAVYDHLDHLCEFIVIHLPYIRKHRDCPNDINEAVSTLVYASARCADLPELREIRKLFGERYGQRFAIVALELLPGNLVNLQIKENLSVKSVSNDVKYWLVDEIARSCIQARPLAIEHWPDLQQEKQTNKFEHSELPAFNLMEAEGKIEFMDSSSAGSVELSLGRKKEGDGSVELSLGRKREGEAKKNTQKTKSPFEFKIPAAETSPENSSELPKEMVYLDDIEEFKSNNKDQSCQDQRLFMFRSPVVDEKISFSGKRRRRRSVSLESGGVKDVESTIYYGQSNGNSRNRHRKHPKKISLHSSRVVHECSLEHPCYFCTGDDRDDGESQNCRLTTPLNKDDVEKVVSHCQRLGELGETERLDHRQCRAPQPPYLRATTLPPEREIKGSADSILRWNSFPIQSVSNGSAGCRHVHPKLPDYDQLAAKFMALKKANLQCKSKNQLI